MTVETYHEVEIQRTADVLGFSVRASEAFCISVRERAEDSAPILDMFATIEEAREAIDEHLEEQPKELRAADCKTPDDWSRWARERAEYEDPFGYGRGREGMAARTKTEVRRR